MNCTECGQFIWHRAGSVEHGERDGYEYRVPSCHSLSDVCEASPTGYHYPEVGATWLSRPVGTWPTLQAWAKDAFEFGQPVGMRRALTRLWSCYPMMPMGVCDPAYMANVIRAELEACVAV